MACRSFWRGLMAVFFVLFFAVEIKANALPIDIYVDDVKNETDLKIYKDRFTLTYDVLPQKIQAEFIRMLEESPLVYVTATREGAMLQAEVVLRDIKPKESDILGSTERAVAFLRINYQKRSDEGNVTSWRREYKISDVRWYPIYEESFFKRPWWDNFEKSLYWQAIKKTLYRAKNELYQDLAQYGIKGKIIGAIDCNASNEQKTQKRFITDLGLKDSLKRGAILYAIRDHDLNGYSYHEIKGNLKVISVYDDSSIVEVVHEDEKDPIKLGDDVLFSTLS